MAQRAQIGRSAAMRWAPRRRHGSGCRLFSSASSRSRLRQPQEGTPRTASPPLRCWLPAFPAATPMAGLAASGQPAAMTADEQFSLTLAPAESSSLTVPSCLSMLVHTLVSQTHCGAKLDLRCKRTRERLKRCAAASGCKNTGDVQHPSALAGYNPRSGKRSTPTIQVHQKISWRREHAKRACTLCSKLVSRFHNTKRLFEKLLDFMSLPEAWCPTCYATTGRVLLRGWWRRRCWRR